MVQNRFHYAITGKTAPEIIYTSADHTKEHMGLETWKNAPDGRILLSDTKVAKNYLPEKEIRQLERAVTGYFDYIEDLIERENAFTMEQFAASVNEFLTFRRYAPPYNLHCGSCGNCCMVYKRKSQDLQGIRSLLYLLGSLRYVDDRCYF